ncbi:MAG: hypothetical protein KatS3mg028_0803 [Bacteroidia bacterium]|nr:MAG: hypothetical protein KatS3mg028_0803 [Bacteroidia bacterium]
MAKEIVKFHTLLSDIIPNIIKKITSILLIFLVAHYINEHGHSDEHKNLPFKNHENCSHIHFYYHKIQDIHTLCICQNHKEYIITPVYQVKNPSFFSVWHPPKV